MKRQTRQERAASMKAARDTNILEAAVEEARTGWQWITRKSVAERANVSLGSINNAFGNMVTLKRQVMKIAVEREILEIVAQGLAENSPIARDARPDLRERAAAFIAS